MTDSTTSSLISTLRGFNVSAEVAEVQTGAAVDRIALKLAPGVKVKQVVSLADDVALSLGVAGVRIYPIPGTRFVGVEVPAAERKVVPLDQLQLTLDQDHPLRFPVGMAVDGSAISARFDKLPHLLVAGTTGSGKSVFMTSVLAHLVERNEPATLQLMLVDPKRVELAAFAHVPHLARPVATDVHMAVDTLDAAVAEMTARWEMLEAAGKKNIGDLDDPPPYLLVVVDELADLMMTAKQRAEDAIVRLLQLGRAAGIHLLLATQRPSTDVITGLIKTNAPSRMVFAVSSGVDSKVALDRTGAETLLGLGDGLWYPSGASQPERIQAAYLSDDDLEAITEAAGSHPDIEHVVQLGSDEPIRSDWIKAPKEETPADRMRAFAGEDVQPYIDEMKRVIKQVSELTATPADIIAPPDAPTSEQAWGAAEQADLIPPTAPTPEETPAVSIAPPTADEIEAARSAELGKIRGEVFYENDREAAVALHYYGKGRRHGAVIYGGTGPTHRYMLGRDWTLAIVLFVLGTAGSLLALPVLPVAAGVWLAWTITRRRTKINSNLGRDS